jgi:DNA-binding transcriptional MerR regulator
MGDTVTLKEAAILSGVTPQTLRKWVKDIPGAMRLPTGEYQISKHELMGYLAQKKAPRSGASSAVQPLTVPHHTQTAVVEESISEGVAEMLRQQVRDLRSELQEARRTENDLRKELKDALSEIRKLEAELRAHLSGGQTLVGTLSRWLKTK